ncbi:Bardet-Biedl syndrome 7 protein homolog isoform X2 [Bacillus rossius redtenbacheri]|uniref:Bardet-Biedl syndrome 7 protein homolog isoform X2 n=1 Tax=Bacillus rossius redtenbacheri TaxID=93214 RepID=UPI002FDDE5B2
MTSVQLDLSRVDYMVVGITAPQTMKLLPNQGAKLSQKVAVADRDGVVQVFSLKRGDVQVAFKTLPGPPAACLELGGAIGTVQDKIFVALKNEVHGYLKKGKLFLAFDTNQTEHISSMHVSGSNLLVCGRHVYSQFYDCVDTNSYVCGDQINDVVALPAEKSGRLVPVLACEDGAVRVLDRSQEAHCVRLPSAPAVLGLYRGDGGDAGDQVLYGAADGSVGLLQVSRTGVTSRLLLLPDAGLAAVTCMDCYDLTGDGTGDLLVGRQDGSLEVYPLPDPGEEAQLGASRLSYTCNESITSIQGGVVGSPGCDEIVAATYTGWIFGLTTELVDKQVALDADGGTVVSHDLRLKLQRLRAEVEEIELKVAKEREKYQDSTLDKFDGVSTIPYITINDKMTLVRQEACYRLLLEAETAIDNVLVQSEVPLHLLDVDKNSAVVSYSECDPAVSQALNPDYSTESCWQKRELRAGDVPLPGQHDAPGAEGAHGGGPARHAARLRHAPGAAQVLPAAPVPRPAAVPARPLPCRGRGQAVQRADAEGWLQPGGGAQLGVPVPARGAGEAPRGRQGQLLLRVHLPRHHAAVLLLVGAVFTSK